VGLGVWIFLPGYSLRTRLLAFLFLIFIPITGLIFWSGYRQRVFASDKAGEEALRITEILVTDQRSYISNTGQILSVLSQAASVQNGQTETCSPLFASLLPAFPQYTNFFTANLDGDVTCSGLAITGTGNLAGNNYFDDVLVTEEVVLGEYRIGRASGKPIMTISYPLYGNEGNLVGVIGASLSLDWFNSTITNVALPPDSTVTVLDRNHTILARYPNPAGMVGERYANEAVTQAVSNDTVGSGTLQAEDRSGADQFYGYATLIRGNRDAYVVIGLSEAILLAEVSEIETNNYMALGMITLLVMALAWWGSGILVHPVNDLVQTTRRLATGDLAARSNLNSSVLELNQLAQTFNEMANTIEERVKERTQALSEASRLTQLLQELTAALSQAATYEQIAEVVVEKATEALRGHLVAVALLVEDEQRIQLINHQGVPPAIIQEFGQVNLEVRIPITDAIRENRPVIITSSEDYQKQYPLNYSRLYPKTGSQSLMTLPLVARDNVIGGIVFGFNEPQDFDQDDLALMQTIALYCAQAMERARLYESERNARDTAEALSDSINALASTLSLSRVLDQILNNLVRVIPHDSATIMLNDEGTVRVVRSRGYKDQAVNDDLNEQALSVRNVPQLYHMIQAQSPLIISQTKDYLEWMPLVEDTVVESYAGVPIIIRGTVMGFLNLNSTTPGYFKESHVPILRAFGAQAATAIQNAQLYEQAQDFAILEERQRLARDLHDAVSQTLFSSSITAEAILRLRGNGDDKVWPYIEQLHRLNRGAFAEMRNLLMELRPTSLAKTDLAELLQQLGYAAMGRKKIEVMVSVQPELDLSPEIKQTFYRITQEALNNVVKHSAATEVEIVLQKRGKGITLEIKDNGRGFDLSQPGGAGLGLNIMRERAEAVGAKLEISSTLGKGTIIRLVWADEA
jgi:nitrate/nitrite-specific signal transduction histidine kinase